MTSSPAFALARYGAPSPDPILRRRRGRSPSPIVRSAKILAKWGQTPLTRTFPWARSAQKVSDPNFSMQLFFGVRRYHRLIFLNSRQQRTRGFLNSGGSVFHLRVVGAFEYLFDYLSNPPPRCALGRTGPAYVWNNVFPDRWVTRTRAPLGPCDDVLYNVKEHAIYIS